MNRLKEEGLINNIGISVYDIENKKKLIQDFNIDSIQAPGNVFDYRIFKKKNQELRGPTPWFPARGRFKKKQGIKGVHTLISGLQNF